MEAVKKITPYTIFRDNGKSGLVYYRQETRFVNGTPELSETESIILPPVYTSLAIKNTKLDTDVVFSSKLEWIEKHGILLQHDGSQIVEADGKQGLLYMGEIIPGLVYDRIIKLTYRHYLCRNKTDYTLYRFSDIGYEAGEKEEKHIRMLTIRFTEFPGLGGLLNHISRKYPSEFHDLSTLLRPDAAEHFISDYDHFSGWVESCHFTWAVRRMVIDDACRLKPLNIKYGQLANDGESI